MSRLNTPSGNWILLVHQLPAQPTNLRVRIWRKLQKIGAVALKNSVYVLPANDKTHEDFQWLKQEIESAGGEAAIFDAGSVQAATDKEIISAFHVARDTEFAALTTNFSRLSSRIREQSRSKHMSPARLASHESELDKLHSELERVVANDFFGANRRKEAVASYEQCRDSLRAIQKPKRTLSSKTSKPDVLFVSDFQNRRWMTRRNLHIDRLASAWLIARFIDRRPRFFFVNDKESVPGAIPFDMFGADFTHHGEDCTFETMLKEFALTEVPGLKDVAEIVHDIDLKDDKFNRLEAAGLNSIINGLSETLRDDRKLLQHVSMIFDGLATLFAKASPPPKRKITRSKPARSRKK